MFKVSSSPYKERIAHFEALISKDNCPATESFESFRLLTFGGIPDEPGIRPLCWKILLNYLPFAPNERHNWPDLLHRQRSVYYDFVRELAVDLNHETEALSDHPLNSDTGSEWSQYWEENKILDQIDKDVRRTLPDMSFFQRQVPPSECSPLTCHPTQSPKKPYTVIPNRRNLFKRLERIRGDDIQFGIRTRKDISNMNGHDDNASEQGNSDEHMYDLHWEAVERVLFIFAKLNSGLGYIQGMNEILAPVYFVLAADSDLDAAAHAEADSFYLFSTLVMEFRDHFMRGLDNIKPSPSSRSLSSALRLESRNNNESTAPIPGNNGIGTSMERMMQKLKEVDVEIYNDLEEKQILAPFFAFRWMTVLLTQEFALPDVIRLWDSLLADITLDIHPSQPPRSIKFDFLITFCCSMLICIREELLRAPFPQAVKMLQSYPISDVEIVLRQAYALTPSQPSKSNRPNSTTDSEGSMEFDIVNHGDAPIPADAGTQSAKEDTTDNTGATTGLAVPRPSSPIKRLSAQFNNFLVNAWNSASSAVNSIDEERNAVSTSTEDVFSSSQDLSSSKSPQPTSMTPSPKRSWATLLARPDNISKH